VAREFNFWVYIMTNKHRTVLYIGITDDLIRRVGEHRGGEIPGFTASYRCKELVYYEHCTNVLDAITREKQLKKWGRTKKAALIATLNPHWRDLAAEILGEEQAISPVRP
jgi:putative endonuclease